MSLARHAPLAVVVGGAALLFPLQALLDRHRAPDPDILEVLPPARILPVLAFGHDQSAADLLEIEATNFLMKWLGDWNELRHEHLTRLYDAVLTLDPQDPGAHLRVATYLFSVANRPDLAREYLDRGIASVPVENRQRWRLFLEKASVELLAGLGKPEEERVLHVRRAGEILAQAADLPGAPPDLGAFARQLATRGLSPLETLRYEEARWLEGAAQGEPAMRAEAEERLVEVRAALIAQALEVVADDVARQLGRAPDDIRTLRRFAEAATARAREHGGEVADPLRVFVEHGFDDPLGVGFELVDGRVRAPGVEARRLERVLQERFLRWQQDHPGAVPTLSDLGVGAVSSELSIEISARGVTVRTR